MLHILIITLTLPLYCMYLPVDAWDVPDYSGASQPCSAPGCPAESTPQTANASSSSRAGPTSGGTRGVAGTFLHPLQQQWGGAGYGGHDDRDEVVELAVWLKDWEHNTFLFVYLLFVAEQYKQYNIMHSLFLYLQFLNVWLAHSM